MGKYSKPTSCWTHVRLWGIAHWCSTPNKTEFVKKFQVVPKFWIKVWGYALYQPVTQKSMAETDFCELSDTTSQQTFPQNFGTIWNFFTNLGFIVRELWLAVPQNCRGSSYSYILSTHWETKCILSFGSGCISLILGEIFGCLAQKASSTHQDVFAVVVIIYWGISHWLGSGLRSEVLLGNRMDNKQN